MKILLVSATAFEVKPFLEKLGFGTILSENLRRYTWQSFEIDHLVTGMGMVATAFHMGQVLSNSPYDLAINAGICGSFSEEIKMGSVVEVVEDQITELGMFESAQFNTIFTSGLIPPNTVPFANGRLLANHHLQLLLLEQLTKMKGSTVNTLQGVFSKLEPHLTTNPPDVETMEGAAFLYSCRCANLPSLQLRSISNMVGERDRTKWEVGLAIHNLCHMISMLLEEMNPNR